MKGISLKIQVTVLVTLLVVALAAAFTWSIATSGRRMILAEIHQRTVLQGRNLALTSVKPLLRADPEFELYPLISRVLASNEEIVSIIIVDRSGKIKGHREMISIDRDYAPTQGLAPVKIGGLSPGEILAENGSIVEAAVPIADQGETIGNVYLQLSKAGYHASLARERARIIRIGLAAVVGGALLSLLLAVHVTRPVNALTKGAEAIGRGRLDTRIDVHSVRELEALAATFNEMARKLDENRRAMLEKERIERELEIAREIQATLLPSHLPHLASFELDAYYHPASEVGGDYFDIIPLDEHRIVVVVGDVAGKGVPGLVVMAMVRILVRALATQCDGPAACLRNLNVLLRRDIQKNFFVTLFYGILDTRDGAFTFSSAAHMPLLWYHAAERSVNLLATTAKPLGVFPDEVFARGLEEHVIRLMPGDLFMQFTDGLSETRSADGEEYGMKRLLEVAIDGAPGGARRLLEAVRESLAIFRGEMPQFDDTTLLAVSALPAGMRRAPEGRMDRLDRVAFE